MKIRFFKNSIFFDYALCILISFLLWPHNAHSKEIREFYNSIRGLSMGDTSVATANDETALPLSPAGLGKIRDYYGTIFDPELEFSKNVNTVYQEKAFTQPLDIPSVRDSLLISPDTYYHARAQLFPSFVAKNFGIGILARRTLDAKVNTLKTQMETFYRDDLALVLGYNFRIWGGRIKVGFNTKLISRIEVDEDTLDPNSDVSLGNLASTGTAKEGVGLSTDAALILTAPWTYLPSIGAVVHDVGGTTFDKSYNNRLSTISRPTALKQDMDIGASISPILSNHIRSTISIEYQHALTATSIDDPQKQYHAGAEINFGDIFFVRAGYNQRYWTGGLELASESFQIQIGSYGEEVGTAAIPLEDRRYGAKISIRF